MKNAILSILCVMALGISACGGEDEAAEAEATPTADNPPAEEAEAEEAAPAAPEGTYSCALETHCREYRGVPYTLSGPDGQLTITHEMINEECTRRQGTLAEGPCSSDGIAGTCTEEHMVWHYRDGVDMASEQDVCENAREGTWAAL